MKHGMLLLLDFTGAALRRWEGVVFGRVGVMDDECRMTTGDVIVVYEKKRTKNDFGGELFCGREHCAFLLCWTESEVLP